MTTRKRPARDAQAVLASGGLRATRRSLFAIPLLGILLLVLVWGVIYLRITAEREAVYRESMASAAILSVALEQHTARAIHQVDQITRFVKYEYEKSHGQFDLASTVRKGVAANGTLVQVSLINAHGILIANTAEAHPKPVDISDREHFKVHVHSHDDELYISTPVLGRVSQHWTLQITRRLDHPDGSFAGVVVVSEDPAYFTSDFYNREAMGRDGVIAVLTDQGAVVARRAGNTAQGGGGFSASGKYPANGPHSSIQRDPLDGVLRIVSYRHVEGYPLGVLVGLSEAEQLADFSAMRTVYLLIAGFLSFAVLGVLGVTTGLIARLLGRERQMTQLVEYDVLTGLPNRYQALQLLRRDLAKPGKSGRLAVLFIDLDNFKTVNDTLGHNTGDMVLQLVAARLRATVGEVGRLARIGGDEFLAVLEGADAAARAAGLAEAIAATMLQPFAAQSGSIALHTSVGIALYANSNDSEMDLLRKAELAMYSAKESGKARHHVYTPQLSQRADHLMKWEQQLRVALAEGQLFLAYQPKLDLGRRCITGFEVLLRWNHPSLGQIPAKDFIPVAESTGLIVPIGNMVIDSACRQLRAWHLAGYTALTLSVNISSMQFWRGDLLATVERCLQKHGCEPRALEFEITETAMMEFPDLVSAKIMALKRLGVRIALDDFGTGYSSLSYLNRFSVDTLKIDRSFVHAIPADVEACVMVTAIVNLGRSLGLCIVVEGVETEPQAAWLSALGPLEAQGFLFSQPVGIGAVAALLARFGVCESLCERDRAGAGNAAGRAEEPPAARDVRRA